MTLSYSLAGINSVLARLDAQERRVQQAMGRGMGRAMLRGQAVVRGRASGRPGPRVVTGDYRRSIVGDWAVVGGQVHGQVGTNAAQGPRLENGFVGPDVLGRVFNQPPFPHFGPSEPEIQAASVEEIGAEIQRLFG